MENIEISAVLDEMTAYVEDASRIPFMGKVLIDGDHLLEMIDRIHALLPEEIRQAKQVLDQSDKLLESIEDQGKSILENAKAQSASLVSETEIARQAQAYAEQIANEAVARANDLMEQASNNAREITDGARSYVDSILGQLEGNLKKVTSSVIETRVEFKNQK